MSRASWLAWVLWALAAAVTLAALVLFFLNRSTPIEADLGSRQVTAVVAIAFLAFPTVGAIIASRHPRNPIGWLFCISGLGLAVLLASGEYVIYALLTKPSPLPGADWAAWVGAWLFFPSILLAAGFLPLFFPDGRLLSRRWRIFVWFAAAATVVATVGNALAPQIEFFEIQEIEALLNPVGVGGQAGEVLRGLAGVGWALFPVVPFVGAVSIVLRFRRASPQERQQIKWLASAVALLAVAVVANSVAYETSDLVLTITSILLAAAIVSLPVATGIAILRHRLYDIDRLISRTVAYALLTALLAGVYAGAVLVLAQVLPRSSDLTVAISTLLVAAAFQPARRRIQEAVDRRFNRRRYDAARTVDAFGARLRDEVDLDALGSDLVRVVSRAMEPTRASLWLRDPAGRR